MDHHSSIESYALSHQSDESHAHFHDIDHSRHRKTTHHQTDRKTLLSNKKVTVTFSARNAAAASSSTNLSSKGSHHSHKSKASVHKFERYGRYKPKVKKNQPWWTLSKTKHLGVSVEDNTKRDREGRRPIRDHWPDRDVHEAYNAKYAGPYNSSRHLSRKPKKGGGSRIRLKLHKQTKTLQNLFSKAPTHQASTLVETTAKIYCAAPAPSRQPSKQASVVDSDTSLAPTTGSATSVSDTKVAAFYKQERERLKPKKTIKGEEKAMMVGEKNTAKQMRYLLAHTHFEELEVEALQEMFHELTHHTNEMDRTLFKDVAQNLLGLETRDFGEQMFRFFDYCYDGSIGSADWVRALSVIFRGTLDEHIRYCFQIYDCRGEGMISREDVRNLLRGCLWDLEGLDDEGEKFDPTNIRDISEAVTKRLQEDKRGFITIKSFSRAVHKDPLQLQVLGACLPDPEKVKTMLSMVMEDYTLFETNLSNKFVIRATTSHWKYAKEAVNLMPYLKRLARAPMRSTVNFGNAIQKRVKKPLNPSLRYILYGL